MKPGAGKNKGSSFERDTAERLSLWLSDGEQRDLLARSEGSGARFTCSTKRGNPVGAAGDLMAVHPLAWKFCSEYVIECKHWRDLELHAFLFNYGLLYDALKKVMEEASSQKKQWMLIAKQNHKQTLLFISPLYFKPEEITVHNLFHGSVWLVRLEDFLKHITPHKLLDDAL